MIDSGTRYVPVGLDGRLRFDMAADSYHEAVARALDGSGASAGNYLFMGVGSVHVDTVRTWGGLRRRGWRIVAMCTALTVPN